jgi:hypothetical protein
MATAIAIERIEPGVCPRTPVVKNLAWFVKIFSD